MSIEVEGFPPADGVGDPDRKETMTKLRMLHLLLGAALMVTVPVASQAGIFFSVNIGPPALPIYDQPLCPGPGYIWTPGYWAYADEGWFWVPGTWVVAPFVGGLWTPGYWGWGGSAYLWHAGYWGTRVGFYGGINYGFGYGGFGYEGGYWNRGSFFYNRSVNNVNIVNIHNVYNRTVVNNYGSNRVSYNGGAGGLNYRPNADQEAAYRSRRMDATPVQTQHIQQASRNRALFASVNHGAPAVAATQRPAVFSGPGVVRATQAGAPYRPAAGAHAVSPAARPGSNAPNTAPSRWNQSQANRPPSAMARPSGQPNTASPAIRPQSGAGQRFGTPTPQRNAAPARPAPQQRYSAPPQRYNTPAPRPSAPQHYNAPAPRASAPQHYNAPAPRPSAPQHYNAPSRPAPRAESAPQRGGEHRR